MLCDTIDGPVRQMRAENKERQLWKFGALAGLLFLIPPCAIWGFWIRTFSSYPEKSQAEKVTIFLSHFPSAFQNTRLLTVIALVSCIIAVLLSTLSLKQSTGVLKSIGVLTLVASAC
jgi:hypothetical protein